MDRLLYLLETNPRLTNEELAVMLGVSEDEVREQIRIYEESGVIKGYRAILDKEKVNARDCTALIEIKVQPKFGHGFDEVAQRIANLEEVAMFVVKRLSPLEDVVSTTTNFILKKYKEQGISFAEQTKDDRGTISL